MNQSEVKEHYRAEKKQIDSRLEDFQSLREASDKRLFQELCFVVFSSQSSAKKSWEACTKIGAEGLLSESEDRIAESLLQQDISFEERKASYVVKNRKTLSRATLENPEGGLDIKSRIKADNLGKTRDWFVENVKGISWKGASHFLRNIGHGNSFAILSTHTMSALYDLEVLKNSEPPKNKEDYLKAEVKVQKFSEDIGIDIQALDLVLWSLKTGEIFK